MTIRPPAEIGMSLDEVDTPAQAGAHFSHGYRPSPV